MKRLLCVAAVAAMCVVPAMGQTNLNLRITSDGNATASESAGATINVEIRGELTGALSEGLALWSTNVSNTGDQSTDLCDRTNVFFVDAPAGDMQYFKRNLGLTNPGPGGSTDTTGYSGTCDGALGLWQVGGGLNTINNTGPTLYPVGDPIPTGVAGSGEIILAEGTYTLPDPFTGTEVVLTLDSAFANVILAGEIGPVYAVEEAGVTITGDLTITASTAVPPVVTDAWSYGRHGPAAVNADLGIQVQFGGASIHEARRIDTAEGRMYLVVTLDQTMAAGAQSVTLDPAVAGVTATGDGTADVVIDFAGDPPADETCYNVDMAGSVATSGGVEAAGVDFCVCYNEADVDRSGVVGALDKTTVLAGANYNANADAAANVTADIDRSGIVAALDVTTVTAGANFDHAPTACP